MEVKFGVCLAGSVRLVRRDVCVFCAGTYPICGLVEGDSHVLSNGANEYLDMFEGRGG